MLGLRRTCKDLTRKLLRELGLDSCEDQETPWTANQKSRHKNSYKGLGSIEEQEAAGLVTLIRRSDGSIGILATAKGFLEEEKSKIESGWPPADGFNRDLPLDHPANLAAAENLALADRKETEALWARDRQQKPARNTNRSESALTPHA